MKTLVIGIDGLVPEYLFCADLPNLQCLMERGTFGRLKSVAPPTPVPGWLSMASSRDPGSLGVYGARNRASRDYHSWKWLRSDTVAAPTLWDQIAREGRSCNLVGVPPTYPPRRVQGLSASCLLGGSGEDAAHVFTHPSQWADVLKRMSSQYASDFLAGRPYHGIAGTTHHKARVKDQIFSNARTHFAIVRYLLTRTPWDYFQFVESGLANVQNEFWCDFDPNRIDQSATCPWHSVMREYYQFLDEQIGELLGLLDEETQVAIVGGSGAQQLQGGFCVNQWLIEQGWLSLERTPNRAVTLDRAGVDWPRTVAWSGSGSFAPIYLNVRGREPQGAIDPADYESLRDEIKARLETIEDAYGRPMNTQVWRPEEIYQEVNGLAPDLIVYLGELSHCAMETVGHPQLHLSQFEAKQGGTNASSLSAFVLSSPAGAAEGEVEDVHLLDLAPTLLELGGYDIPPTMQGRSFAAGQRTAVSSR